MKGPQEGLWPLKLASNYVARPYIAEDLQMCIKNDQFVAIVLVQAEHFKCKILAGPNAHSISMTCSCITTLLGPKYIYLGIFGDFA